MAVVSITTAYMNTIEPNRTSSNNVIMDVAGIDYIAIDILDNWN